MICFLRDLSFFINAPNDNLCRKGLLGRSSFGLSRFGFLLSVDLIFLTAVPNDDFSFFTGFVEVDDPLIRRAAEAESDALLLLDIPSVDEDVGVGEKLVCDVQMLRVFPTLTDQLLIEIARIDPYALLREAATHFAKERKERPLIFGLHRFTAEDGQPRDHGIPKGGEDLLLGLLREGRAVVERPRFPIETVLAGVAATADEEGGADALAVGNVVFLDGTVLHA